VIKGKNMNTFRHHKSFFVCLLSMSLLAAASMAHGVTLPPPAAGSAAVLNEINSSLGSAIADATLKLQPLALKWLSSFIAIQFVLTQIGLLKSGADIEAILGKLIGSLLWFAFCFYVMTDGTKFIDAVAQQIFGIAGSISGGGAAFDFGTIISQGADVAAEMIKAVTDASSFISLVPAVIIAGLLALLIIGVTAFIAFKVFLLKVEIMLVIMMSPLSFSFMGLNALKDQGIAPFKSLISIMYRVILLAVVLSVMAAVGNSLNAVIESIDKESFLSGMWSALFGAVIAYLLLAALAYKSDSIASNLASGSTNLGSSDTAVAAAAGAAAGALVGSAAGAVAGTASKAPQAMSDVLSAMSSTCTVKNATQGKGTGGMGPKPVGMPGVRPPSASTGPTTRNGAPVRPGGGAGSPSSPSFVGPQKPMPAGDANYKQPPAESPSPSSAGSGQNAGVASSGSGETAGIGGAKNPVEDKLDKLLSQQGKGATTGDRLAEMNRHLAQESGTTQVSIHTGNSLD
jgi:type IV secretion system protein TrbL